MTAARQLRYDLVMRRDQRGQALVELSLLLPLLLLLVFGIIEVGRVYSAHLTVVAASREGARWGVLGYHDEEIENRARDVAASLDSSLLSIAIDPPSPRMSGTMLRVRVRYPVDIVLPLIDRILPDPVWVSGETAMRME